METDKKDFIQNIKEEIEFLGWSLGDLSESTFIGYSRLKSLMGGRINFKEEEIKVIKKRLGIE